MARHFLSINIPDISNEGIFIVEDTSIYTPSLPVSCMNVQITPPGFHSPTVYTPDASGFRLILNACTLGIAVPTGCSQSLPQVSDGIYQIHYSVSPNDQVFVSYNYLRIVSATNRLNELLCAVSLSQCLPSPDQVQVVNELNMIRGYLRSAQTNCNERNNTIDGINQYRYAIQLMDKLTMRKPSCMNLGSGVIF